MISKGKCYQELKNTYKLKCPEMFLDSFILLINSFYCVSILQRETLCSFTYVHIEGKIT